MSPHAPRPARTAVHFVACLLTLQWSLLTPTALLATPQGAAEAGRPGSPWWTPPAMASGSAAGGAGATAERVADGALGEKGAGIITVSDASEKALNDALVAAVASGTDTVVDLRPIAGNTIMLSQSLATLGNFEHAIWVVGDPEKRPVIDGAGQHQILAMDNTGNGFIALSGVEFENGLAKGGDGQVVSDVEEANGGGGGGGGLGAGGALFINSGTALVYQSLFDKNTARGGTSRRKAGGGRTSGKNQSGWPGGAGGRFNETGKLQLGGPGAGGAAGSRCPDNHDQEPCPAEPGQHASAGGWGSGGGGGGGGGSAENDTWSSDNDGGRNGGNGGSGGWGAGGGGGGGGGTDIGETQHGNGGSGGTGGATGADAQAGVKNGPGGWGGGGAGLGGAIFVRTGAVLEVVDTGFSGNQTTAGCAVDDSNQSQGYCAEALGPAIFTESNQAQDNGTSVNFPSTFNGPTLTLALVDLNGNSTDRVFEGERAYLKVNNNADIPANTSIHLYLSDTKATATPGTGTSANDQDQDYAWGTNTVLTLQTSSTITADEGLIVTIPGNGIGNTPGANTGIQTYIDALVEGDESFSVGLLPGRGYRLGATSTQTITIEDINYQVELLPDSRSTTVADVVDALEPATGTRAIDVNALKGLGYVTVQARRKNGDSAIHGDFFNNALAGGLPVHYRIERSGNANAGRGEDYFSNQVNYNNSKYDPQVYNAVVIPVTAPDAPSREGEPPPGQARIWFAALPDAIKEDAENYTLTLESFQDPSCEGSAACAANTPAGHYYFYTVKDSASSAKLTIDDSDEFTPAIAVAEAIDGALVEGDDALVPAADSHLGLALRLTSQPTAQVSVSVGTDTLTFTPQNWFHWQAMSLVGQGAEALTITASGGGYDGVSRAVPLATSHDRLKVSEGSQPDLEQRGVVLRVAPRHSQVREGGPEAPVFELTLGQPLARDIAVRYDIDSGTGPASDTLTIPAYARGGEIAVALADNEQVDGERTLTLTLDPAALPAGVAIADGGGSARITVADDDRPAVRLSQHLPERPSVDDLALFLPQIELVGLEGDKPRLQSHDPGIVDITLRPVGGTRTDALAQHGLLKEIAPKPEQQGDFIQFPERPTEAMVVASDFQFSLPSGSMVRVRGTLTPSLSGEYRFAMKDNRGELWLNPLGDDPQGLVLVAGKPLTGTDPAPVTLEAGKRYSVVGLCDSSCAAQWDASGELATIPQEALTPAALDNGIVVETWNDITAGSIAALRAHPRFKSGSPDTTRVLTRELDLPASDERRIGRRITALLTPSESGLYRFAIASQGDSELRLSGPGLPDGVIAAVDGREIYGRADISTVVDDYGGTPITRTTVKLTRDYKDKDGIGPFGEWSLDYDSPEPGSLPFGSSNVTLLSSEHPDNDEQVCNKYQFVGCYVEGGGCLGTVVGDGVAHAKLYANMPPTQPNDNCDNPKVGIYPDYDGGELTFYFQDLASADVKYENLVLDGHTLSDETADFPEERQWNWSETQLSSPIHLQAGSTYALEVLHVNGQQEKNHLSVAWQPPRSEHLELLPAAVTGFPRITVPLRLRAQGAPTVRAAEDAELVEVSLALDPEQEVSLLGRKYVVDSLTLRGQGEQGAAVAGAHIDFASGFLGAVRDTVTLSAEPVAVTLTAADIANDPATLNLTVGQEARLGLRLAAAPADGIAVQVHLTQSGAGTDPGNDTAIELSDDQGLTFDATNWDQPQFVTVRALAADATDPDRSVIDIQATAKVVAGGSRTTTFADDTLQVRVFPDNLRDESVYFVAAGSEPVSAIGFGTDTAAIAAVRVADGEPLPWSWTLAADGALVASNGGEAELLRLVPVVEDIGEEIPADTTPVTLTAAVQTDTALFTTSGDWRGTIQVSGIVLEARAATATAAAAVAVTLENGRPRLAIAHRLGGDTTIETPRAFRYNDLNARLGDTLITEYGELRVDAAADGAARWSFEPNPRPQPAALSFEIIDAAGTPYTQSIPPAPADGSPRIRTSLMARPDPAAPLVHIAASNTRIAEGDTTTLTVSLDQPAPEDLRVFYSLDHPADHAPGNIALNLAPIDTVPGLEQPRALHLGGDAGLALATQGWTIELWLRPGTFAGTQGLALGRKADGTADDTQLPLLQLSEGTLTAPDKLSVDLAPLLAPDTWFHIAYRADNSGQALYVNGERRANVTTRSKFTALLAVGWDGTNFLGGGLDEVRVWDGARSDVAIRADYAAAVAVDGADTGARLAGYWTFNGLDTANRADPQAPARIIDSNNTPVELPQASARGTLWSLRRSLDNDDHDLAPDFGSRRYNVFALDAAALGGRTRIAVADFDGDGRSDAAITDGHGVLTVIQRATADRGALLRRQVATDLAAAAPLAAGDLDGDGAADLLVGGGSEPTLLRNRGALQFAPEPLRRGGQRFTMATDTTPALADLNGDGQPELVLAGADGRILGFELRGGEVRGDGWPLLPRLPAAATGYAVQFVDLDRDGDLDAVLDHARLRVGGRDDGPRYFENYGDAHRPYFVAAPHSDVAGRLAGLDRDAAFGDRVVRHPYAQVTARAFGDWDGDGDQDLFQSDLQGLIHLRDNGGLGTITIPAGTPSASLVVATTADARAETTELLQLRLVEGRVDGADYHTATGSDQVVVEVTDDDVPALVVEDADGKPVSEPIAVPETGGEAPTVYLRLASEPATEVTVAVASADSGNGLVARPQGSPGEGVTLRFNPDDWDQPQPLLLHGVDDRVDDTDAPFTYTLAARSSDPAYENQIRTLAATSSGNDDRARVNLSLATLPPVASTQGSLGEGEINTLKVTLASRPTRPVTVTLAPQDGELTLYPQRRVVRMVAIDQATRHVRVTRALRTGNCVLDGAEVGTAVAGDHGTLCWHPDGRYHYVQTTPADAAGDSDDFSYVVDNGYGELGSDTLGIALPPPSGTAGYAASGLAERGGHLLAGADPLAGQPMRLVFTPADWDLERTVAVAAVDDQRVEYDHRSAIRVLPADSAEPVLGHYGVLTWEHSGGFGYRLLPGAPLTPGTYSERRFFFTRSDGAPVNHRLDFTIEVVERAHVGKEGEEPSLTTVLIPSATVDGSAVGLVAAADDPGRYDGHFALAEGAQVTGVAVDELDPVYLALTDTELAVAIHDNDQPIVRAGIDLNAPENTHPGYFTLSVREPVGLPGGLAVRYRVLGKGQHAEATAQAQAPTDGSGDPGPDYQITDTLSAGYLFIPQGKTRVSFPIFPVDDFAPEHSLAVRYETVWVEVLPPTDGDAYDLDHAHPQTTSAAVRILDNEEVGLKAVLPADGLVVEEGTVNALRVGLKSQPRQPVELRFYDAGGEVFLAADPVTFDATNWNQWQGVSVRAFNNLVNDHDALHPRYADLYFTLGAGTQEPFYNSLKGALNLTTPAGGADEAQVLEGTVELTSSGQDNYGTVKLTGTAGDFTYTPGGNTADILAAIAASGSGKVFDVFPYSVTSDKTTNQRLAVEIRALRATSTDPDKVGKPIEGDYGVLTLNADGTWSYVLNPTAAGDAQTWAVRDEFVYVLSSPGAAEGTPSVDSYATFAIGITADHIDDVEVLTAVVNGKGPGLCAGGETEGTDDDRTVCDNQVHGTVLPNDVPSSAGQKATMPTVQAVGRTTRVPVVTNLFLRDANGNDLRVGDARILANPLYGANPLNRPDALRPVTAAAPLVLAGRYGTLSMGTDGHYTYQVDRDGLAAGLDPAAADQRIVHDRFAFELSNGADGAVTLVSVYEAESGSLQVEADGERLSERDGSFVDALITQDAASVRAAGPITVTRLGSAGASVRLQEQALDPTLVADGLAGAMHELQARLYDVSLPVLGRLGGDETTRANGSSTNSKVPSFADRLLAMVENEIRRQPVLTTAALEQVLRKALQATFGHYGIPLEVYALDSEKLLLRLSFGYGVATATDALESDLGVPGFAHVSGQIAGTAQLTLDLVFGIKFRPTPEVFIVTAEPTLASLLAGTTAPAATRLGRQLRTMPGSSVPTNGVQFADYKPANADAITDALKDDCNHSDLTVTWGWQHAPANFSYPKTDDMAVIVGSVGAADGSVAADFVTISLHQPRAIAPDTAADVVLGVQVDPDGLLTQGSLTHQGAKAQVLKRALSCFVQQNTSLAFKQTLSAVTLGNRRSQALTAGFAVAFKEKVDSTPGSISARTYAADLNVTDVRDDVLDVPVRGGARVVLASTTYEERQQTVATTCNKRPDNRCVPEKIKLEVTGDAPWSAAFPGARDLAVFKTHNSATFRQEVDGGVLTLKGMLQPKAGGGYEVRWSWSFSADGNDDSGWDANGFKQFKAWLGPLQGPEESKIELSYVLARHPLLFLEEAGIPARDPKFESVSKLTLEAIAGLDLRGGMSLGVIGGTIDQALTPPVNTASNPLGDQPRLDPAEIYGDLVGNWSDRDDLVTIEHDPTYIAGKYGTLALTADGKFSYLLHRELSADENGYSLNCAAPPEDGHAAKDQALCGVLLGSDGDEPLLANASGAQTVENAGYRFECAGGLEEIAAGSSSCIVKGPWVIVSDTSADHLTRRGVPSLEGVVAISGQTIPGWEANAELSNRMSMHDLYQQVAAGQAAVDALRDEFFLATDGDSRFKKLELTLKGGSSTGILLTSVYDDGVPFDGFTAGDHDEDGTVDSWTGGNVGATVLRAGPGGVQPMAKVRAYVDVALRERPQASAADGILHLTELAQGGTVQFSVGVDAGLFSAVNLGLTLPGTAPGYELPLPALNFKLGLVGHADYTAVVADAAGAGAQFTFGVYDLGLDLGSLVSSRLAGPLADLSDKLAPVRPVARTLGTDIKVLSKLGLQSVFDANADGAITVLELPTPFIQQQGSAQGQKYAEKVRQVQKVLEFVSAIGHWIEVTADLGDELAGAARLGEPIVSVDGFVVAPEDIRVSPLFNTSQLPGGFVQHNYVPYVDHLGHIILGSDQGYQYTWTSGGAFSTGTVTPVEPEKPAPLVNGASGNSRMAKVKNRLRDLHDQGVIALPMLSDPFEALKLVFGAPAEVMAITVPHLDFSVLVDKSFRIWGPVGGVASFEPRIGAEIGVGVDTGGLVAAICGSDTPGRIWECGGSLDAGERALRLLNGIYLRDWTEQSYKAGGDTLIGKESWRGNERQLSDKAVFDRYELYANVEGGVGVGLNVGVAEAYLKGGVGAGGGVDLVDLCEATTPNACVGMDADGGGSYDGKIRAYDFARQLATNAGDAFSLGLELYASLDAQVKAIGITVWERRLGRFPLYEVTLEGQQWSGSVGRDGRPVVGGTVFFDADGDGLPGIGEPIAFTDMAGRAVLHIPYASFDRNGDGVIDQRDGRIVLLGGVDAVSGEPLLEPLLGAPERRELSPLTSARATLAAGCARP